MLSVSRIGFSANVPALIWEENFQQHFSKASFNQVAELASQWKLKEANESRWKVHYFKYIVKECGALPGKSVYL